MNSMPATFLKCLTGVALFVGVCVGAVVLLIANQDYFQETEPKHFMSYQAAEASGIIKLGWLPDFLPTSATEIYEKHNFDYNTGIITFTAEPSDLKELSLKVKPVPPERLVKIAPSWLYTSEPWFPKEIVKGSFESMQNKGFTIFAWGEGAPEKIVNQKIQTWYVAISTNTNRCYAWH